MLLVIGIFIMVYLCGFLYNIGLFVRAIKYNKRGSLTFSIIALIGYIVLAMMLIASFIQ